MAAFRVAARSPLHGGVGRNIISRKMFEETATSPLHGGVGRNNLAAGDMIGLDRRPFTGAWVETFKTRATPMAAMVAPSRGRGSKPSGVPDCTMRWCRPFTGAWVETRNGRSVRDESPGRPFTGAWVETTRPTCRGTDGTVAPSRGRGSKLDTMGIDWANRSRPFTGAWVETGTNLSGPMAQSCRPFTGAWVETKCREIAVTTTTVAPSRGRGSKLWLPVADRRCRRSPLHGGVGRNVMNGCWHPGDPRRPFTGAWVETSVVVLLHKAHMSPLHRGVGRNREFGRLRLEAGVAPSRGRGSKQG